MAALQRRKRPREEAFETPAVAQLLTPRVVPGTPLTVKSISTRLWQALCGHGKDAYYVAQFLRGMPWEDIKEAQEEWKVWRFLGAGGHGGAAVWTKTDEEGHLLDKVVLKEQRNPRQQFCYEYRAHIPTEAVLQNLVNVKQGCESESRVLSPSHFVVALPWPLLTSSARYCTSTRLQGTPPPGAQA